MYEEESQEPDVIEMTDEDGNVALMEVLDYFFYNGEEYAVLTEYTEEEDHVVSDDSQAEDQEDEELPAEEVTCFIMKVIATTGEDGEELEEFVPVEDPVLEKKLIDIATTKLNDEDTLEE